MRSKVFSILILVALSLPLAAQYTLTGVVTDAETGRLLADTDVYDQTSGSLTTTDSKGKYEFNSLEKGTHELVVFAYQYQTIHRTIELNSDREQSFNMSFLSKELSEVVINQAREEVFGLNRLKPVEGTAIYAGKKTEVVLMDQLVGNMSANNARQIYSQVVGLNIYENNDAGLQLNIGGRGLDPNRTANFNTRQNGYDISADVLGYPESYYTPPAEALREIQVIRGAASLQYGTQFGGLINFKMKRPSKNTPLEFTSRQSVGSFALFTSFNSLSGTKGKWSYYGYFNYKRGNGFRDNSGFDSQNLYAHIGYQVSSKTKLEIEGTYLKYLAQQAGGLTDTQFRINPNYSNRERNWFQVNWKLLSLKLKHKFTSKSEVSVSAFGLDASRDALGFRGIPNELNLNPVDVEDEQENGEYSYTRDLIKGEFKNWGIEGRFLTRYKLLGENAVFLIGTKYYHANNTSMQGAGSNSTDADFKFANESNAGYPNQSAFTFPNRNFSVFGENIFYLTDKLSITPGFRFEHISTASEGTYRDVVFDRAGNVIRNQEETDNRSFDRDFALFGIGLSYHKGDQLELYGNVSQNYRSVTFSDIRVVNPSFIIDPDISDERGFTADLGMRGKWGKNLSYDAGVFSMFYNDRIGTVFNDRADRVRRNIGDALIYGVETFFDWNLTKPLNLNQQSYRLNWFVNAAITESTYTNSMENNVKDKKVEFIPLANLKTGIRFGYKNLLGSIQYTYLSEQFTDAENSAIAVDGDQRNGIVGEIPAYDIVDISVSYRYKKWKLESGINNVLNNNYFTRRATGYPGPGIIPADPRTFYIGLELKLTKK